MPRQWGRKTGRVPFVPITVERTMLNVERTLFNVERLLLGVDNTGKACRGDKNKKKAITFLR